MEKEFVNYNQALALKELGFDEPCFGFHSKIYGLMMVKTSGSSSLYKDAGECLAPTYSQAFRWFREKHGLHIHMCPEFYKDGINYCWQILWYLPKDKWTVGKYSNVHGGTMLYGDNHEYPTKEEAENACIDKLIEIVKNKTDE